MFCAEKYKIFQHLHPESRTLPSPTYSHRTPSDSGVSGGCPVDSYRTFFGRGVTDIFSSIGQFSHTFYIRLHWNGPSDTIRLRCVLWSPIGVRWSPVESDGVLPESNGVQWSPMESNLILSYLILFYLILSYLCTDYNSIKRWEERALHPVY